jgi:hypothetical protein
MVRGETFIIAENSESQQRIRSEGARWPHGIDFARAARLIWIPAALLVAVALLDILSIAVLPHRVMGMVHVGMSVLQVEPRAGFDRAGIRAGDRLEDNEESQRLWYDGSLFDYHGPYRITVHRGSQIFRTSVSATPVSGWSFVGRDGAAQQIAGTLAILVALGISGWLVTLRPTVMTLALFLFAANPPFADSFALQVLSPSMRVAAQIVQAVLIGACPWFLVIFALRFPDDRIRHWPRTRQLTVVALAFLCALLAIASSFLSFRGFLPEVSYVVLAWLTVASLAAAMVIMFVKMSNAPDAQRAKLRWAIVGVSVPLACLLAVTIVNVLNIDIGYWQAIPQLSLVVLYASIAYVLTQSHFVDPRFTINRAAVWSATAGLLLAGVAGVDWITSRLLAQRRLSDAIDALAAIILGFFLNAIHHRLESWLELIIFRAKHRANRRLRTIGSAVTFASDQAVIESAMVTDAANELDLTSSALFLRPENGAPGFQRVSSFAWTGPWVSELDENELVVRLLKTERRAVDLREWPLDTKLYPGGLGKPRVAIPVFTREELRAFALYSGHRDHTELDSSEIDLLSWLAEKCAAAFDHVEVCTLRALLSAPWAPGGNLERSESSSGSQL